MSDTHFEIAEHPNLPARTNTISQVLKKMNLTSSNNVVSIGGQGGIIKVKRRSQ